MQALRLQKVLAATGVPPEDLAKSLLVQKALADSGVGGDAIAKVLNRLAKEAGGDKLDLTNLVEKVTKELAQHDGTVSQEDVAKAVALTKAIEVKEGERNI